MCLFVNAHCYPARGGTVCQAAVAVRIRLTAANPTKFNTPAVAERKITASEAVFRPKDATDYLVTLQSRTQVRSRKHEAVVKAFGEHARAVGWAPATNVHPRDLVLRKPGRELLCEVKVVGPNAEHAIREAIGQLITYRHFLYPGTKPEASVAVFSSSVGPAFVDLLESIGIASVWAADGDWLASASASTLGLNSIDGDG